MEKFTKVSNLEIAYSDINSDKKDTIIFIHGNSGSKKNFKNQLESGLFKDYRLLALDLPGHGESSQCFDKDCYTFHWYAKIICSFIHELKIIKPVMVGHSLGGHISVAVSKLLDIKKLVIFHAPPLKTTYDAAHGFKQNPHFKCYVNGDLTKEEILQLLDYTIYNKNIDTESILRDYISTHPDCRTKLGNCAQANTSLDEMDQIKNAKLPVAILTTDHDPITNDDYIRRLKLPIWKNELILVKNSGHYPQMENPDEFNQVLMDFLTEV